MSGTSLEFGPTVYPRDGKSTSLLTAAPFEETATSLLAAQVEPRHAIDHKGTGLPGPPTRSLRKTSLQGEDKGVRKDPGVENMQEQIF